MKKYLNFASLIFLLGALVMTGYLLTQFFVVTDNAFVVRVQTPVAAKVPGTVTEVLVQNGQMVQAGDPLIKIDDRNYVLALQNQQSSVDMALAAIAVLHKQYEITGYEIAAAEDNLDLLRYELKQKGDSAVRSAVPQIEVKQLQFEIRAQENQIRALKANQERDLLSIEQAELELEAIEALRDEALLSVEDTIVRAQTSGVVTNQFLAVGHQVAPGDALFSLSSDGPVYVQANFNETDLAGIKPGDKVTIYPRIYLWEKSFEGVVKSLPFGVDRQFSPPLMAEQVVVSPNRWLQLPQRLPLIIEVVDPEIDKYPLQSGMSTYVYVHD